jgi:hypothetical protein
LASSGTGRDTCGAFGGYQPDAAGWNNHVANPLRWDGDPFGNEQHTDSIGDDLLGRAMLRTTHPTAPAPPLGRRDQAVLDRVSQHQMQ